MAARFSAEHLAGADGLAVRADGLRGEVVLLAPADATAYGRVLDAYRTSRDDEEARRRNIREALTEAADVPLSIAGIGAEVADSVQREIFDELDAPILRVTGADVPMPYNKHLERAAKVDAGKIVAAVNQVLYRERDA
jgi:hypothetical protein